MGDTNHSLSSKKLSEAVVKGMQEKKALDIVVMDIKNIPNAIADFFIVCSGNSSTQIEAISDSIDAMVFNLLKESPWHIEGRLNNEWVLLDYIDVVAHIFNHEKREYYALENLWGDGIAKSVASA